MYKIRATKINKDVNITAICKLHSVSLKSFKTRYIVTEHVEDYKRQTRSKIPNKGKMIKLRVCRTSH